MSSEIIEINKELALLRGMKNSPILSSQEIHHLNTRINKLITKKYLISKVTRTLESSRRIGIRAVATKNSKSK